ncbi:MAG: VacB/RNase II family 3'-5' exoribonuclease [Desulfobacterota bacterium]|nr:VacB/RNase II family 3'-5' exoribonuclease [Thermodesulfobacteriota bacterium]
MKNRAIGRLSWNPKGYAFVDARGRDEGVFVPHEALNSALPGDLVEVSLWHDRRGLRGKVVAIVERARLTVTGRYVRQGKFGILEPLQAMPYTLIVPLGEQGEARSGDMVSAVIIPPRAAQKVSTVTARVERSLDIPDTVGDDLRYLSAKYGLAWRFPEEVEREADRAARIDMAFESGRRRDLRDRVLFTIDGIDARDFDDAVGIEKLSDGTLLLTVAIADVAHAVRRGTALDREARARSFSVYFPEVCIPMLPEVLSNGAMSLKPDEERLAVAVEIVLGPRGRVISYRVCEAMIRSRARLTYEEVGPFLEGTEGSRDADPEIAWRLKELYRISQHLHDRRRKQGSLDFDIEKVKIETSGSGAVQAIGRTRHGAAERLIEEAMLLANRTVCAYLLRHGMPVLFRVHEPPRQQDLMELMETLAEIGYSSSLLGMLKRAASSGEKVHETLQGIADASRGRPLESFVNMHILRSLQRARYSAEDLGHFGLAFTGYLHFTSPIRRYPDLMIHRLVKQVLDSGGCSGKDRDRDLKSLKRLGTEVSDREEFTDNAMMEAIKLKTAAYMVSRLGEEFDAVITSVQPYGMFVEVLDPPVDGLVRIDSIPGRPARRTRRARSPRLAIGQTVRVKLVRADRTNGQLDFTLF